jgi:hypothetical protein
MEKKSLVLEFDCRGIHYTGWATPSDHLHENGEPSSYHVVLNQVFFGNLTRNKGKWLVDEQRPSELTAAVGECLDKITLRENRMSAL